MSTDIIPIDINEELTTCYLDYAMSVIVGRALPDVRDGLKPVHRRVLYAMHELNNDWNKAYKKSARIVGDVIGKYHPHGDVAIYDTIVRMAQDFSLRYMLIDGQGNFGSVDGDSPAAMRYTEIRMSKLAHEMLMDIEKETVDFVPNYDGTEHAPSVLPTRIPQLLLNGSSGIAVGMATNIPPHNICEIMKACMALIDQPDMGLQALMEYIPGPDFPTAGLINGRSGIVQAYETGRGKMLIRGRAQIDLDHKKPMIVISELPYQVNKAKLIEHIASLVRHKQIEGIAALRDESDKDGMRIVVELKRADMGELILNQLFNMTDLEVTFGINMVALDRGQPKILNLKQILEAFVAHRQEVVTRRSTFELAQCQARAHILEGLSIALMHIDLVVELIKSSSSSAEALQKLMQYPFPTDTFVQWMCRAHSDASMTEKPNIQDIHYLSRIQAQSILDLRLHRLTGLEQSKIQAEYLNILSTIQDLNRVLSDHHQLMRVIRQECELILQQYSDSRRTEIIDAQQDLTNEDIIPDEDRLITLSREGYIKAQTMGAHRAQHRGGRGKSMTNLRTEDVMKLMLVAHSKDLLLCFSSFGKVYGIKTYELPLASNMARGKPIVNLLNLQDNEYIEAIVPVGRTIHAHPQSMLLMITRKGWVKKVLMTEFAHIRSRGMIALSLDADDRLMTVHMTAGQHDVMIFTDEGRVVRFHEQDIRSSGRLSRGVRGIRLDDGCAVIAALVVEAHQAQDILTAASDGYGKRTAIEKYRLTKRGARGVSAIRTKSSDVKVVAALPVSPGQDVMFLTDQGILIRTPVDEISVKGRVTRGVRLIHIAGHEILQAVYGVSAFE